MKEFLICTFASLLFATGMATAEPPGILNHQGRIAVNGTNYDGTGWFKFALVDGTASETFWTGDGTHTGTPGAAPDTAVSLAVSNGHYAVRLGDTPMTAILAAVFANNADVRLRTWFSTDNAAFEHLFPDRRVTSSGYALSAASVGAVPLSGLAKLNVDNAAADGIALSGTFGSGNIAVEGAGTLLLWYPGKSAFRAGTVTGPQWSDPQIGEYSTAFGRDTRAGGDYSTAFGENTSADGTHSAAFGYDTRASGDFSTAFGETTSAEGMHSTAFGRAAEATGDQSTAFGDSTHARGEHSTAMGLDTTAHSFAEVTLGLYSTDYPAASEFSFNATDRLFVIGNGTGPGSRSDALTVLKGGDVGIGTSTPSAELEVAGTVKATGFMGPLDGGSLAAGSVTTAALADNAVTLAKIANGAVGYNELGGNSVDSHHINEDAIDGSKIEDNAINVFHMSNNSVGAAEIGDGQVGSAEIADNSLTAADLAASSVGTSELAFGSVTANEIANDAVDSAEIRANAVGASEIAAGAVGSSEVANGSIAAADIGSNQIFAEHIAASAVGASEIATGAVASSEIADNSITAADIAANAVGASEIASASVGSAEIINDSVTATDIAANAVGASEIASNAVGSSEIGTGAVGSDEIANGSIASADLASSIRIGTTVATQHSLTVGNTSSDNVLRLIGPDGTYGWGARLNFGDGDIVYLDEPGDDLLRIQANKVGIRGDPSPTGQDLQVFGNASKSSAGDWLANSDRRIKTDIRPLDNALEVIRKVRPVGFRYTDEWRAAHPEIEDVEYFNVIAQEFAEVFPDAVRESGETLPNGESVLQVDTYPAQIHAIAAIAELDAKVRRENAELRERLQELEDKLARLLQAEQAER